MPKKGKRAPSTAGKSTAPPALPIIGPYDVDDNFIKLNFQLILGNLIKKYVTWSPTEAAWLRMRDEASTAPKLPLRIGVSRMLRKSFGGCFIRYMNKQEATTFDVTEKKFEMTEFMLKIEERPTAYTRLNDFTEDIKKYLNVTVKESFQKNGWISQKMLVNNLPTIRLCFQRITEMDGSLKRYQNLLALIATSNYLKDFAGKLLPPNLNMLELFGNLMYDILKLMENPPPLLLYLGIGRNYLSKISSLALIVKFQYLYFLDLSENDFLDIKDALENISKLPNLKCLSLEGNPCSMPVSYVHIVQRICPQVEYLDGINYIRDFPVDPTKDDYRGVLQIHGIRFFRVPRPRQGGSKDYDKLEKFYQLEFEIPLLDPALRHHEARSLNRSRMGMNDPEVIPPVPKGVAELEPKPEPPGTRTSVGGRTSQSRSSKLNLEELEGRRLREKMLRSYERWVNKDVEPPTLTTFMSGKAHWAKIISFPSPCIEIPVEPEWWRQLRDSMRSIIIMRLYYKEVALVKVQKPQTGRASHASGKRGSRRASRRSSRRASRRQSAKKQSIKGGKRKSTARKSVARKSVAKRASKAPGKRQSMAKRSSKATGKRQSKAGGGGKRKSMTRRGTQWSKGTGKSGGKSRREEILLVRNLIAKIPVPVEITKWNVPFMGYTWDIKERCLARRYPGIEKEKYSGSSFSKAPTGKKASYGSSGKRKSRASSAGKRKSRASTSGKRKSRASSAGKRQSKSPGGKRASKAPGGGKRASKAPGGKRASKAPGGGKRASQAGKRASKAGGGQRKSKQSIGGGGKRKSRASSAGGKRKSTKGGKSGKSGLSSAKGVLRLHPNILTCHVGIGLLRLGKEAPTRENPNKSKKSIAPRKSKAPRKSRASKSARKSKSGAQRKSMKRKSMKRSSKVAKK